MEIRRRDFDYVVAAGWVSPARYVNRDVGVRKTVEVPLYAVGDLEDALQAAGVDWEAVRAVKPGEVSPLREHTRLPAARAEVVRAFCARLGSDGSVEVWPHFWNAGDQWEIDWEQRPNDHPNQGRGGRCARPAPRRIPARGEHRLVHGGRRRHPAGPGRPGARCRRRARHRYPRRWVSQRSRCRLARAGSAGVSA